MNNHEHRRSDRRPSAPQGLRRLDFANAWFKGARPEGVAFCPPRYVRKPSSHLPPDRPERLRRLGPMAWKSARWAANAPRPSERNLLLGARHNALMDHGGRPPEGNAEPSRPRCRLSRKPLPNGTQPCRRMSDRRISNISGPALRGGNEGKHSSQDRWHSFRSWARFT